MSRDCTIKTITKNIPTRISFDSNTVFTMTDINGVIKILRTPLYIYHSLFYTALCKLYVYTV